MFQFKFYSIFILLVILLLNYKIESKEAIKNEETNEEIPSSGYYGHYGYGHYGYKRNLRNNNEDGYYGYGKKYGYGYRNYGYGGYKRNLKENNEEDGNYGYGKNYGYGHYGYGKKSYYY